MAAGRVRARRGSGSIRIRNGRLLAQVSLGTDPSGRRIRRSSTFDSRTHGKAWIATQQLEHRQLANPVHHALRGYDALHLAAAERIRDDTTVMVAGDRDLCAAARTLGMAVAHTTAEDDAG